MRVMSGITRAYLKHRFSACQIENEYSPVDMTDDLKMDLAYHHNYMNKLANFIPTNRKRNNQRVRENININKGKAPRHKIAKLARTLRRMFRQHQIH